MSIRQWRPAAQLPVLQARARLNGQLRDFFADRDVLEVETPLLSHAIGTDPALHPVTAMYQALPGAPARTMFLQTSPEFAMKRLLAAGSGPIFQLCKAFRNGETGRRHNPEFTMLEWYRPGFTLTQLMDEVAALVDMVLDCGPCLRLSYRQLFQQELGIDPHAADAQLLAQTAARHIELSFQAASKEVWLDLLYSQVLEPGLQAPVFIYDYPASHAALAKLDRDEQGQTVALRFELVIGGMEIANGYDELADPYEQERRFQADLRNRSAQGLPEFPTDAALVAALVQGLPACAGVALGVDRLLMLQCGASTIDEVLAFPHALA
jgi:elongation factor P--(R)-beta-lysine ligase